MCSTEVSIPLTFFDLGSSKTVFFHEKAEISSNENLNTFSPNEKDENSSSVKQCEKPIINVFDTLQHYEKPKKWFFLPNSLGDFSWKSICSVGKGLPNVANICFLNATVQALVYCPPFAQDCLNRRHSRGCPYQEKKQLCGFCHFEHHVCHLLKPDASKNHVAKWSSTFLQLMRKEIRMNGGQGNWFGAQNCAHEWLTQFFDFLIKYDLPIENRINFNHGKISTADISTIYVHQLFSFFTEESKICCACSTKTARYELNTCFRVPLNNDHSVVKALKLAFEPELLSGSNQVLCETCGILRDKKSCRAIHSPPNVLILLLQRTRYHGFINQNRYRSISKNNLHLDVPLTISLNRYLGSDNKCNMDNSKSNNEYHFIASVNHSGSAGFGHYWAVVKSPDGLYYKLDDECRSRIPHSLLADHLSSAYLLFYQRDKPVVVTDFKTETVPPSNTCSFALALYANSKKNYSSASLNQEAQPSKIVSNKTQNQKTLHTENSPSKKVCLKHFKKRRLLLLRRLSYGKRKFPLSNFGRARNFQRRQTKTKRYFNKLQSKEIDKKISSSRFNSSPNAINENESIASCGDSSASLDVIIPQHRKESSPCRKTVWKPLKPSQRLEKCKDIQTQYGCSQNPVTFWENECNGNEQIQKIISKRTEIMKSLLPKTTRRNREDFAYDKGRKKKIKTKKHIDPFDFTTALSHNKMKKRQMY